VTLCFSLGFRIQRSGWLVKLRLVGRRFQFFWSSTTNVAAVRDCPREDSRKLRTNGNIQVLPLCMLYLLLAKIPVRRYGRHKNILLSVFFWNNIFGTTYISILLLVTFSIATKNYNRSRLIYHGWCRLICMWPTASYLGTTKSLVKLNRLNSSRSSPMQHTELPAISPFC